MRFDRYLQFLPGQDANRELQKWFRFYSNGNYEAEIQLILERVDAPSCELGKSWVRSATTWLCELAQDQTT